MTQYLLKEEDVLKKKDFTDNFQKVIDLLVKMQEKQGRAIQHLQQEHARMMGESTTKYDSNLADLKKQVNKLFVEGKLNEMHTEQKMSMSKMKEEMNKMFGMKMTEMYGEIKRRAIQGREGKQGRDGKFEDNERLLKLEEKVEELSDKLKKQKTTNLIMAGQNPGSVQTLGATGTKNDTNTVFTFAMKPLFIVVNGQMLHEDSGWAWTNSTTATLDNPVGTGGTIIGVI